MSTFIYGMSILASCMATAMAIFVAEAVEKYLNRTGKNAKEMVE